MSSRRDVDEYTAPVEDYLKTIYDLERGGAATTTTIAGRLEVAPASVTGMVRRLAGQGLLEHERYRGVRLTDEGRRVALNTIRRHRVIETYLVRALGYSWDLVHDEAERLEHAASDELVNRMAASLGDPGFDPHGAPIPTPDGFVEESEVVPLSSLETGGSARLARVRDEDPELLRHLDELGLRPGAAVTLLERAPFDGPLTIRVGGTRGARRVLGVELAAQLQVLPD